MEQFRQLGEALGSLKALMVFKDNIQINKKQCCLLLDVFTFAYDSIAEEIRQNVKFEEKHDKWKFLQQPSKEIHRISKEGEAYVKQCLEIKDRWAIAITFYQNKDCVELHIHNLLSCIPVVISQDFCDRYDAVWKEDRRFIMDEIREKRMSGLTKQGKKLTDLLLKNLEASESMEGKLLPSSILMGSKDYQGRRRLGNSGRYKEITWLGESFVIGQISGDVQASEPEITSLLSLSHTKTMEFLCGFVDKEERLPLGNETDEQKPQHLPQRRLWTEETDTVHTSSGS